MLFLEAAGGMRVYAWGVIYEVELAVSTGRTGLQYFISNCF